MKWESGNDWLPSRGMQPLCRWLQLTGYRHHPNCRHAKWRLTVTPTERPHTVSVFLLCGIFSDAPSSGHSFARGETERTREVPLPSTEYRSDFTLPPSKPFAKQSRAFHPRASTGNTRIRRNRTRLPEIGPQLISKATP